jgi:hypothetical protein
MRVYTLDVPLRGVVPLHGASGHDGGAAAFRSDQQSAGCCRIGDEAALLVGGSNVLAHRSFPT